MLITVVPSRKGLREQDVEKEVTRKAEYERTLDYMCQQLEQLEILDNLPSDLEQREAVVNRAMDIRSAFMLYLATHIYHESFPLGTTIPIIYAKPIRNSC